MWVDRRQIAEGPFMWSTVTSLSFILRAHFEHQHHCLLTKQYDLASWSLCFFIYDMEIIIITIIIS